MKHDQVMFCLNLDSSSCGLSHFLSLHKDIFSVFLQISGGLSFRTWKVSSTCVEGLPMNFCPNALENIAKSYIHESVFNVVLWMASKWTTPIVTFFREAVMWFDQVGQLIEFQVECSGGSTNISLLNFSVFYELAWEPSVINNLKVIIAAFPTSFDEVLLSPEHWMGFSTYIFWPITTKWALQVLRPLQSFSIASTNLPVWMFVFSETSLWQTVFRGLKASRPLISFFLTLSNLRGSESLKFQYFC